MQDTEKEAKGTGHHQNGLSLLSASPSVPTSCCSYCRMVFSTWWKQELWEPQSCTSYDLNHPVDISIIVSLVPSLKITRKYAHGCSLGEELYMASLTVIVLKKKKKKGNFCKKKMGGGGGWWFSQKPDSGQLKQWVSTVHIHVKRYNIA